MRPCQRTTLSFLGRGKTPNVLPMSCPSVISRRITFHLTNVNRTVTRTNARYWNIRIIRSIQSIFTLIGNELIDRFPRVGIRLLWYPLYFANRHRWLGIIDYNFNEYRYERSIRAGKISRISNARPNLQKVRGKKTFQINLRIVCVPSFLLVLNPVSPCGQIYLY